MEEGTIHLNPDLTTTQTRILPSNPQRRYALFLNDSNIVIYLSLGIPAATNEGIRLNASGGWYEITLINPFYGAIYAVSLANNKRLMITEVSNAIR